MTHLNDDIQKLWNQSTPPIAPLIHVRREQLKMLASTMFATLCVLLSWWFVLLRPDTASWSLAIMVTGFIPSSMLLEWWMRHLIWRAMTRENTQGFIAQMTHRLQLEWRIWRLSRAGFILVTTFLLLWTPYKLLVDRLAYTRTPIAAVIGVGGILLLLASYALWLVKTRRTLRHQELTLDALAHDFEDQTHTET